MRFIGCKENLLPFIDEVMMRHNIKNSVFCDIFAGTTSVSKHYKKKGFKIISNDIMAFSYCFQYAYIKVNQYPKFERLQKKIKLPKLDQSQLNLLEVDRDVEVLNKVITYLNTLPGKKGFIYNHYCPSGEENIAHQRNYFSDENGMKIDAIRDVIQEWFNSGLLTQDEFYVLLTSLIESVSCVANISGTYGAFLKKWDPRALKSLTLKIPNLIKSSLEENEIYQEDANKLIRKIICDVLYLDPPYNTRQYATNYHILETIARWDNPKIYGKTGLRPYRDLKSNYCNRLQCKEAFKDLIENASCRHILLSYNNEGLIPKEWIIETMSKKGKLEIDEIPYRRFKSDSNNGKRNYSTDKVTEIIYYVQVN